MKEWPYLVEVSSTEVCVVVGTIYNAVWFDLVSGDYIPRFGNPATLAYDSTNHQYVYTNGLGYITKFFDYSGGIPTEQQGQFKSYTDLGGNETVPSYDATTHLITSFVRSSGSYQSGFYYDYYTSGDNVGQLRYTTLNVDGTEIQRAYYEYYGASDANGSVNDLMRVTIQQYIGSTWTDLNQTYYRYYLAGDAHGFAHALKYLVGPVSYASMVGQGLDPVTATNTQVAAYADNYFEYDNSSKNATLEVTAGGTQTFNLVYTDSGNSPGYNNWDTKAVETLPNGSTNIIYTNYAGQVMLQVQQSGSDEWLTCNQYDSNGHLILVAHSSAVASYSEASPGLVTLHASTGYVESYVYYSSTNISVGAVEGYLQYKQVQEGGSGTPILVREYQYTSRTAGSTTIYLMAKEICYPDASDPLIQLECLIYSYTWQGSTLQIDQKTTTLPVVSSGQNGSGSADSVIQSFDSYGYCTWAMDARGFLTNWTIDLGTGTVSQLIRDVDTGVVSGAPSGWATPSGGGLNLVTDYTVDGLGRITQELGPSHAIDLSGTSTIVRRAKWTVYQDVAYQVWQGAGYATGTGPSYTDTLINPVALTFMDNNFRPTDMIQAVRSSTSGALSPSDSFPQSSWVAWTNTVFASGPKPGQVRQYFDIPSSGGGSPETNYNETDYVYDSMLWLARQQTQDGTITRTVYNPIGWVLGVWVGTDDTGATDNDPTGGGASGNNMVQITGYEYDGGSAGGDGNLTQLTQYVDGSTTRVTSYAYDFRDRQTVVDGEIDFYQVNTIDNLGRVTQVDRYDTTSGGHLIARSATGYDARGRVYQTIQYAVDPSTGSVGNALTNNLWYDPSGNLVQVNAAGSALLQRSVYDGVSRPTGQYFSTNSSTDYPYPVDVSDDAVYRQVETSYDNASNVVEQLTRERFHDATGTGGLTDPSGSQPKAQVTYVANWPDPLGRIANVGNYGTNQGTALSRPDTVPTRSDTVLITTVAYNSAGRAYQTTDPLGKVNQSAFDAMGRVTQLIENYGGSPERETDYVYHANGQVYQMTVVNATTGDQMTQYNYGTTLSNSDVASNQLLRTMIYPDDSMSTPDEVVMAYNRQGQMKSKEDQLGTIHAYSYDALGRLASDAVTTLGSGVDGSVLRIGTTYEVRGMAQRVTSYNAATAGDIVNEVWMVYNDFAQLIAEYQAFGEATTSSPVVQYAYADGSANTVRRTGMTYPSGKILYYLYGDEDGPNDRLGRVESLTGDDEIDYYETYTYMGLNRIVQVYSTEANVKLTYIQLDSSNPPVGTGGDQYTGWDQFGRVVDQRWTDGGGTDLDRTLYGYDAAGNTLWCQNVVAATGQDEFYSYDGMYQLTALQRGTLNSDRTGLTGTPDWEEDFALDPTGNWNNYTTKVSGATTLNQPRTATKVNAIASISGSSALIAQDAAGNITTSPSPLFWTGSLVVTYDAWNRLMSASGYDGRNRLLVGIYSDQWQLVQDGDGRMYVWGMMGRDDLVWRQDAPYYRYYALASLRGVSSLATGATVLQRMGYNAYGLPNFMDASFAPTSDAYNWNFLYGTYYCDTGASWLYAVRNRWLHPTLGRWMSRDPIGYLGGINLYAYCGNDPTNCVDALGLGPCDDDIPQSKNLTIANPNPAGQPGNIGGSPTSPISAIYSPAAATLVTGFPATDSPLPSNDADASNNQEEAKAKLKEMGETVGNVGHGADFVGLMATGKPPIVIGKTTVDIFKITEAIGTTTFVAGTVIDGEQMLSGDESVSHGLLNISVGYTAMKVGGLPGILLGGAYEVTPKAINALLHVGDVPTPYAPKPDPGGPLINFWQGLAKAKNYDPNSPEDPILP